MSDREKDFDTVFRQYSKKTYWLARSIVHSHEDADDICQNAWIKIYERLPLFRGDADLYTWIYRIVYNEAIDFLRKNKKYHAMLPIEDVMMTSEDTPTSTIEIEATLLEKYFHETVNQLPTLQKTVFYLRYFEEMSYKEISIITGKHESTLKSSYHFAVEKIIRQLKTYLLF